MKDWNFILIWLSWVENIYIILYFWAGIASFFKVWSFSTLQHVGDFMNNIRCRKRALKIIVLVRILLVLLEQQQKKRTKAHQRKGSGRRSIWFYFASAKELAFSGEGKTNKKQEICTSNQMFHFSSLFITFEWNLTVFLVCITKPFFCLFVFFLRKMLNFMFKITMKCFWYSAVCFGIQS